MLTSRCKSYFAVSGVKRKVWLISKETQADYLPQMYDLICIQITAKENDLCLRVLYELVTGKF